MAGQLAASVQALRHAWLTRTAPARDVMPGHASAASIVSAMVTKVMLTVADRSVPSDALSIRRATTIQTASLANATIACVVLSLRLTSVRTGSRTISKLTWTVRSADLSIFCAPLAKVVLKTRTVHLECVIGLNATTRIHKAYASRAITE